MLCPCWELLNPGAAPAVLPQPRRKHPSAQRFVLRPSCSPSAKRPNLGRSVTGRDRPETVIRLDNFVGGHAQERAFVNSSVGGPE